MKKILLILTIFLTLEIYGQDAVRINHLNYTTVFSKSLKYPILVEWWETRAKNCSNPLPRKDQFQKDPQLPEETDLTKDYRGSGTDKGHMCPAASNECLGDKVLTECFYFSNMAPQYHQLNAGDWEKLEKLTRQMAIENDSVHVWAGSVGVVNKFKRLSIPEKCWKVIYTVKTKQFKAYIFDNTKDKSTGLPAHEVGLNEIKGLTGLKIF